MTEKTVAPTPTEPPVDPVTDATSGEPQSQDKLQTNEVTPTQLPSSQVNQAIAQQPHPASPPSPQTPEQQEYVLGENSQEKADADTPVQDAQQTTKANRAEESASVLGYWPYLLLSTTVVSGIFIAFKRLKT